ncbi:MAG TPA: endo-1,4-beta-xylanase, partial [Actinotalea sp.]|nr:endo-1,4-beta-xylanase [Actinotalea sp.]
IDPWTPSGSPALGYVDADGGKALSITRAADFEGIQSPTGLLAKGVVYTFTMRAKLPDDSPLATTDVRFVVKPAFTWVGNATVTKDAWTTVTGEYTVPGDLADLSEVQVYLGSADQGAPYTFLVDDLSITAPAGSGGGNPVDLTFDFEDATLQGWEPRDAGGNPTVSVTDAEAHESTYAALVSDRAGQGDGIRYDVSEVFEAQVTYEISAWVKMAAGEAPDTIWLSMQRINAGADSFDTVGQFSGITATGWTQVTASYTMASADTAFLYFETSFNGGGAGSFLIDDVTIRSQDPREVQDLTPLKDTVPFPLGVAIDSRETTGSAAQLTLLHFNQLTAENHMKVEAWYDGDRQLRMHPEAVALMDFARANDLTVYGHVLAWHSQTPAWFFQDAAGQPLTTSEADKALMRQRLNDHNDGVAQVMAERYGPFGSDTNPLVAWDVVNEVVADTAEHADGLRRSEWYRILGEEFIDLAFRYADEAFNGTYAAPGADRPVTLFINDYNTEQAGKQSRYYALVSRLVARGVPIDGVGHQFHVSLSTPVGLLDQTLRRFDELGLVQVVTELDVTVGTPVTQPNLIEQGYYYRDAFNVFRAHADKLYSVTVWGLDDARSWRSEQAPLLFDGQLQAKPAYYGAAGAELPARILAELSFGGDVPLGPGATADPAWDRLPLIPVEGVAAFQTRWA